MDKVNEPSVVAQPVGGDTTFTPWIRSGWPVPEPKMVTVIGPVHCAAAVFVNNNDIVATSIADALRSA